MILISSCTDCKADVRYFLGTKVVVVSEVPAATRLYAIPGNTYPQNILSNHFWHVRNKNLRSWDYTRRRA
jgi:hypothetical protein